MQEIKNILFPTDFSPNSMNALPFAIDLAQRTRGKLLLLNVYDIPLAAPSSVFNTREQTMAALGEDVREKALNKLKAIINDNGLQGKSHRCFVRQGSSVKDEILKLARKRTAHIIVMGMRGQSASRFLMGSVTRGVLVHSSCPVLAIPDGARFFPLSNIFHATDLRSEEPNTMGFLKALAGIYASAITIVHVGSDIAKRERNTRLLELMTNSLSYPQASYVELTGQNIPLSITTYLKDKPDALLSVTTHTVSLLDKLFHNSITKGLLLHTHIPLLGFSSKKYDTIFLG